MPTINETFLGVATIHLAGGGWLKEHVMKDPYQSSTDHYNIVL